MACTDYRVDLVAAKFGDCKCGYPKPAHVRSPSGQGSQGTAVDSAVAVTTKSDSDLVPTWRKEAQAAKLRRQTAVGDAIGRPSENPTVILNWQQEVAGKKARRKTTTGSTCAVAPTPTAGASIFTSAFTSALKRTEGGIDVRPPVTEYTEPTHVNKAPVSREAAMLDGRGLPRAEKLQSMPKVKPHGGAMVNGRRLWSTVESLPSAERAYVMHQLTPMQIVVKLMDGRSFDVLTPDKTITIKELVSCLVTQVRCSVTSNWRASDNLFCSSTQGLALTVSLSTSCMLRVHQMHWCIHGCCAPAI